MVVNSHPRAGWDREKGLKGQDGKENNCCGDANAVGHSSALVAAGLGAHRSIGGGRRT